MVIRVTKETNKQKQTEEEGGDEKDMFDTFEGWDPNQVSEGG